MKDITQILDLMRERNASDLYYSSGNPVSIKINGVTHPLTHAPLEPEEARQAIYSLLTKDQISEFETNWELNFAFEKAGTGRFRGNVFRDRGTVGMVIRFLADKVPSLETLHMPVNLYELILRKRGLILVVGAAGSGKSTTIASMLEYRNEHERGHILTVEDPVEYRLEHKNCVINQREVGVDTKSFEAALMNAMREAPDVLFIGEIRSYEIMRLVLTYADTGVLVVSTLHANSADQALGRILSLFPAIAREQVLVELSLVLQAIISQRLVIGVDGRRCPAVEVLLNTLHIADLIKQGKIHDIKAAMKEGVEAGMLTFDMSLYDLYRAGKITYDEALKHADSTTDLALRIKLSGYEPPELGPEVDLTLDPLLDKMSQMPDERITKPGGPV